MNFLEQQHEKQPATHDEVNEKGHPATSSTKIADIALDAKDATDKEHAMSLRQAIKLYPKAIAWSMFLSSAVAMEGFQLILIASFFAFPPFTRKFGELQPDGSYEVTAPWQSALSNGARVGEILGLTIHGIIAERYGYRITIIGTLMSMIAFIFILSFAQNIGTLVAGEILMGIPWGVFQTLTTTYAAEVCPVVLRGYLTTYVNLMWAVGPLGFLQRSDQWAYRIPYALQWMWPPVLLIGTAFAPDSPWWLARRSRYDDAKKVLRRLTSAASETDLDQTVAMMRHTDELEKEVSIGTSYWDCFKGTDLRRTEIVCVAWAIQPLCGASLMGFSAYFFRQAGLSTHVSFDFSMALYAIAMVGVIIAWFAIHRFGRRTLHLAGLTAMCLVLLIIGFVALAPATAKGPNFAIGSLLLVWALCYNITVGTITFSIVTEIPSNRLRTKTVVLGRNLYNVVGIINGVITPRMLNPSAWDWKGKAGFFWAGMCFLCLIWSYFRLPEPKGRTYGEMDALFERKVSARKFKTTAAELFSAAALEKQAPKVAD
ncbi:Maltose permease MAL31 [Fulvia fulva]|nr:Maltose permease MAL31 [Fulvia fulva]KAK4611114.1 Maltose permease MAL31 [Fulvia fulva]WPV22197.1 Maltose permease MAL31 [Fulvia fulva]